MRKVIAIGVVLIASLSLLVAEEDKKELFQSDESSICNLVADHYHVGSDGHNLREIWLRSTASTEVPVLLTKYERNAEVMFSPDCTMIALNDDLGSNLSEVQLFRKTKGLVFKPLSVNVNELTWTDLERRYNSGHPLDLFHMYVNVVAWLDPQHILLRLWGHTDAQNHVNDWYCILDIKNERILTDLSHLNHHSVTLHGVTH